MAVPQNLLSLLSKLSLLCFLTNALRYSVPLSGLEKRSVLTFSRVAFDNIWAQFWLGSATGMEWVETMDASKHRAVNRTAP